MTRVLSRRGLLRSGVAAAAVVTGAGVAGCAQSASAVQSSSSSRLAPSVQKPKIVLGMRAWGVGSGAAGSPQVINSLLYQKTEPWRAKHKGVDINIIENTGGPQGVIASIIAGSGPDIYHSWHPGIIFAEQGYAADLRPYLKQYNANLSVFNKAQMDLFILADGSIRALPYYLGTQTMAVCEGMLDQLGLQYPAPNWTFQDYAALCTAVARSGKFKTGSHSQPVYGGNYGLGNLGAPSGYLPPNCILQGFGGSYVAAGNQAKCNLDSPGAVEAVGWATNLAWNKILAGPGAAANFGTTLAMTWAPSFFLPQAATGWRSLKWRYYNMPSFPLTGPVTGATEDLWAMNPHTKHPSLAWDLLHWCTFEPSWQVAQMEIFLLSPALSSLWDHWLTYVPQIAPPLANKNLAAFATLARNNHAYPQQFFRYSDPSAENLVNAWGQKIWTKQIGVHGGLAQLTAQVDAMESTGGLLAQNGTAIAKSFPVHGSAIAAVQPGL